MKDRCACGKRLPPPRGKGPPHKLCLDCKDEIERTRKREAARAKAALKRKTPEGTVA